MAEKDRGPEKERDRRIEGEGDDVQGHRFSEDLTGGDDVQGHHFSEDLTRGDDVAGHIQSKDEEEDVAGHVTPPQSIRGSHP
jgi:hypothetical protein